jgi:hypothetical protein
MPLADLLSNSFPSHLSPSTSCLDQVDAKEHLVEEALKSGDLAAVKAAWEVGLSRPPPF